jgi:Na+/alanine symporter
MCFLDLRSLVTRGGTNSNLFLSLVSLAIVCQLVAVQAGLVSQEIDGVRKEKERLTATYLSFLYLFSLWRLTERSGEETKFLVPQLWISYFLLLGSCGGIIRGSLV